MSLARTLSLAVALCAMAGSPILFARQPQSIRVILDTDANNELDDQHAIAYDRMENYRLAGNAPPNAGPGIAENAPPPILELDRVRPRRSVWEGATWRKPIVLKSANDAADHFEADALADLLRQVDFGNSSSLFGAALGLSLIGCAPPSPGDEFRCQNIRQ